MTNTVSPFKLMQLSYKRFLYAQIIFWIIALMLIGTGWLKTSSNVELDRLLQVMAVVYSFVAVIVGLLLFRRRVESVKDSQLSVREKLTGYYNAAMVQWILLVSAGFFCGASYLLVGNWAFPALAVVILAIYGGLSPFKQKVKLQLRLSDTDVAGV